MRRFKWNSLNVYRAYNKAWTMKETVQLLGVINYTNKYHEWLFDETF